jgi:hypothetical protein
MVESKPIHSLRPARKTSMPLVMLQASLTGSLPKTPELSTTTKPFTKDQLPL